MAGPLRDKSVFPEESGDNEDLCKGHLITTLLLSYKTFNYRFVADLQGI
jgi:hypothetical protein